MTLVAEDPSPPGSADHHGVDRERYLPQIDALRGIAVLAVLFFHLYRHIYHQSELSPLKMPGDLAGHVGFWRWFAAPSLFGYAGVPLFFVISGFCIHHSFLHARRPFSYLLFMGRRFWRIYPAYVLAIAVALLLPGNLIWKTHHVQKSVILHLLFLHNLNQTTIFELSPPLWTLAAEFQFYAAYPVFLLLRRALGVHRALLVSFLLCAIASPLGHLGWAGHFILPLRPVMYWAQWCLGALIAERLFERRGPLINLPLAICICVGGICLAVPIDTFSEWNYLAWAILFAAIMERWLRRNDAATNRAFTPLVWIGTISYSIYLLHVIILEQLLPKLPIPLERRYGLALLTIVPLIIAASATGYYLIESPGIAAGRKVLARCFPLKLPGKTEGLLS